MLKLKSRGRLVKTLQEMLVKLGYHPGPIDGIFGEQTSSALSGYQRQSGLVPDGIYGPDTERSMSLVAGPGETYPKLTPVPHEFVDKDLQKLEWKRAPADVYREYPGFPRLTLREDVAVAYNALYEDMHALGGIITTAGGKRSLKSRSGKSRSKRSMHYLGRAFDMALPTGMQDPVEDPYVVERDGRKWIVWCRTKNKNVERREIDGCYVRGVRTRKGKIATVLREETVAGRFINFTEMAKKHGFERISGRRTFFRGGPYSGAEWWHFQYEVGLEVGVTTFGEELRRVYSLAECREFIYWNDSKGCRWGKEWV